jgi:integrase
MAGEGSVFKRSADGRWVAQLSSGPRGHRRLKSKTARTKAEASRLLRQMKADEEAGLDLSGLSLGAYLRQWLDDSVAPNVAPNTLRGYEAYLKHTSAIADIPLQQLTAEHLERFYNGMTTRRRYAKKQPQPASPKTVRNLQVMLRMALGHAEQRGHIRRNPALLVPLRHVTPPPIEALTPERARAILHAIAGDPLEAAYALALLGLRSAEIRGLARSDLDLDGMTLTVRRQVAGSGPNAVLRPTKTAASVATMPLPTFVVDRLRGHLVREDARRPIVPLDDSLVFVTETGYAIHGSWFTKHFQRLLKDAGLPKMRLHDLRHGAATLLVDAGAHPRIVQEYLRHAPGSRMTMARYAHVTAAQQRDAADLLDAALTTPVPSVTQTVTEGDDGVVRSREESPIEGVSRGKVGSGGRIRTYDQAVNSRPLYH